MTTDNSDLIPHIILNRKLPSAAVDNDIELLKVFNEKVQKSTVNQDIKQLFEQWKETQHEEMIELRMGGKYSAFYVKEQNCGVLIEMNKDRVIYSDFQCALDSEIVLQGNDHMVTIPSSNVSIPKLTNIVDIENELNEMYLTTYLRAMTQSTKGGQEFDEIRNVSSTVMMSYFKSCLMDSKSKDVEGPVFQKKFKDDVVWDNAKVPFRRSGMYMCLKAILQLVLIREMGEEDGTLIYKAIILDLHCHILETSDVNSHLKVEMLNKIGRRMAKLGVLMRKGCSDGVKHSFQMYEESWLPLIQRTNLECQQVWDEIIETEKRTVSKFESISLDDCEYRSVVNFENPRSSGRRSQVSNIKYLRHLSSDLFPHSVLDDVESLMEQTSAVYDFESWMAKHSDGYVSSPYAVHFQNLFHSYSKYVNFYKDDVFGSSRMILYQVKIISILDKIAFEDVSLYAEHKPAINVSILDNLLLRSKREFELKFELQQYFGERQNAQGPCLFDPISASSFDVKYVSAYPEEFRDLKSRIEQIHTTQTQSKVNELELKRAECAEWRRQNRSLDHDYFFDQRGAKKHGKCEKCKFGVFNKKCVVAIYEKKLTADDVLNNAALFELKIPSSIGILRDVLFEFNLAVESISFDDKKACFGTWS